MVRIASILCGVLAVVPALSSADTAGVSAGGGGWQHEPAGDIRFQGDEVDVEQDLDLGDDTRGYAWLAIEHPVPLLPNVRFGGANIQAEGAATVGTSFTFGGQSFGVSENIDSRVQLSQRDVTLYYQVVDTGVDLDLGMTIKYIDGDARVRSLTTATVAQTSFSGYVPMAYGRLNASLPLTGLSVGIEGSGIGYGDTRLLDYSLRAAYESKYHIGLEGGYRRQQLKLDDVDSVFTDITVEGPYLGIFVHF